MIDDHSILSPLHMAQYPAYCNLYHKDFAQQTTCLRNGLSYIFRHFVSQTIGPFLAIRIMNEHVGILKDQVGKEEAT